MVASPARSHHRTPDPWFAITRLKACAWSLVDDVDYCELHRPVPEELAEYRAGFSLAQVVYPTDLPRLQEWLAHARLQPEPKPIEFRMINERQGIVWVRQWLWPMRQISDELGGLMQVLTEQKTREAECLRICERERTAIGQELHDDLCQLLAGISCMVEVIGRRAELAMPDLKSTCGDLVTELHAGMERARALAHGLVPSRLIKLGLGLALNELARQTIIQRQVLTTVRTPHGLPRHDPEHILHIYRIAQESITNAIRHGHATRIEVRLQIMGEKMRFTVRDNGFGLPPLSLRNGGIGLHIMQYRAGIIGGVVSLRNLRTGGTLVELIYPHRDLRLSGVAALP